MARESPPHRGRGGREVGASPILPVEGGKGGSDTPARTLLQKMGFRERQQGRMREMVCFLRVAAGPVATRGPRHPCSLLSSRSVCPEHFSKTVRGCVRSACRDRKLMYRGGKKYSGCRGSHRRDSPSGAQKYLAMRTAKHQNRQPWAMAISPALIPSKKKEKNQFQDNCSVLGDMDKLDILLNSFFGLRFYE